MAIDSVDYYVIRLFFLSLCIYGIFRLHGREIRWILGGVSLIYAYIFSAMIFGELFCDIPKYSFKNCALPFLDPFIPNIWIGVMAAVSFFPAVIILGILSITIDRVLKKRRERLET